MTPKQTAEKILQPFSDVNAWTIHPDDLKALAEWALEMEREAKSPPAYLVEALNSGDGVYRP